MKNHPDTEGFWMDYKNKVAALAPGGFIKKSELDRVMYYYINDLSVEDCAAFLKSKRRQELMG